MDKKKLFISIISCSNVCRHLIVKTSKIFHLASKITLLKLYITKISVAPSNFSYCHYSSFYRLLLTCSLLKLISALALSQLLCPLYVKVYQNIKTFYSRAAPRYNIIARSPMILSKKKQFFSLSLHENKLHKISQK